MGYKAAVQVLKKAEALKAKVSRQCDLLNDLQAWTDQQQLQTIYHQVLVLDLEYALDKKVEQELWTLGFKNHISALQDQARNKKNPRRTESQALLSWCLEAASGFYLTLLQELCSTYDLDLPFRKRGAVFGKLKTCSYTEPGTLPQSSSCLYICQYCLVHLGDIARYRNQRRQAESFYKHAILVSPNSGHPYNQLGLLEASQGDKLSTVFHYVRGIAVKNPFPGALTNLANTVLAAIDKDDPLTEVQTKMSVNEFILVFLKVHGLLHSTSDLAQADLCVKSITATLTALVATQSFTAEKLIKMTVINLYALKHVTNDEIMKIDELTEDERRVRELVLDLLAGSLSAFLLPVYTLKADESILDYYALPAIRLISMWIKNEPNVLTDSVFTNRLQIWPGYCKLLNTLQSYVKLSDYDKYSKVPLSYDRELQGFLPLQEVFEAYDFRQDILEKDAEKCVRAKRLIEFGNWLTTFDVNGSKLIICSENKENKLLEFQPGCFQPDPTDQLLEEMKSFKVTDNELKVKGPEKRGGILKPQGSLEKSREERVQVKITNSEEMPATAQNVKIDSNKMKRVTQNVALQSIYKKIEESKQVKFSTETTEKEKEKTSPKAKPPSVQRPPINQPPPQQGSNPSYRTQTFNQNHPALGNLSLDGSNDFFNMKYQKPPNVNIDRNIPFPNSDLLPMPNISKMPPQYTVQPPQSMFSNAPHTSNNFNTNSTTFPSNSSGFPGNTGNFGNPGFPQHTSNANNFTSNANNFTPLIEKPMSFNVPSYGFNKDERPQNSWWPNQIGQGNNFHQQPQQQDYYRYNNQPFGGNMMNNHSDIFNSWNNMPPRSSNHPMNYGSSNQSMSMRQAMLNETKHLGASSSSNNLLNNAPGYSLFNPTSWTPTLPGQLRNNAGTELRQQSLFTGPAPQSLQQLLEQQNQLQKGDT